MVVGTLELFSHHGRVDLFGVVPPAIVRIEVVGQEHGILEESEGRLFHVVRDFDAKHSLPGAVVGRERRRGTAGENGGDVMAGEVVAGREVAATHGPKTPHGLGVQAVTALQR